MPINGFTVGRDVAIRIVTGLGVMVIGGITGFRKKQDTTEQRIKLMTGQTEFVRYVDGWSGSITLDRRDPVVDAYFALIESNYFQGIPDGPVSFTETISEVDSSITQWRYQGVLLKLDDGGNAQGDSTLKMSLSWVAKRRIQLA